MCIVVGVEREDMCLESVAIGGLEGRIVLEGSKIYYYYNFRVFILIDKVVFLNKINNFFLLS